ncbi:hypothetical protein SG34_013550 [Thalassomonas viridans]|uniref:Guanylate kinase-like domain-containing protein n=1 Tax=Thalassomonas viridans TaxID=137584 RepID=A0AAE9Z6T9_9GAMM|nr:hypothetical protein [Thalassomonas viridans]WDE07810.1 hypothetical protein SG34_013550 [Thalassomonas viridans]
MDAKDRVKLGLNVIIKKKPYLAGLVSSLTGKDCSTEDAFVLENNQDVLPFISTFLPRLDTPESSDLKSVLSELIKKKTDGKTIFLICGASAAGKDTLASLVKENLYDKNENTEYLYCTKYTTRERRANEGLDEYSKKLEPSGNYVYCKTLEEMNSFEVDLEYSLYGCHYSLCKKDLSSSEASHQHLACIYGKLENIAKIKQELFDKYNRIPFSILIKAPIESHSHRINGRHTMSKSEKSDRVREMERQSRFIKSKGHEFEANFDLVVNNGNDERLSDNANLITEFIHESILWANKALKPDS